MTSTHGEVLALLSKATMDDLERLMAALDRWPRPTRAAVSLQLARDSAHRRSGLEMDIASEIARCASAPLSRGARVLLRRPARDELHEVVTHCAARLGVGVKVPPGGTLRGRLAALTGGLVDRAVRDMTPAEQQRIGIEVIDRIDPRTSSGPDLVRAAALPALHSALGPVVLAKVVEGILVQMTSMIVGRHVARAAVSAALTRLPLGVALGPIAWGSGAALVAWELQKPALRKLLPAVVTLGFVALRER